MNETLTLSSVRFRYASSVEPIFSSLTLSFNRGWTGIAGANGGGKTTLLKLLAGDLLPEAGTITGGGDAYYLEQRADAPPSTVDEFLFGYDKEAIALKRTLGVDESFHGRWDTLSYGERKRIQAGCALLANARVLLADEPTNHLDQSTRRKLILALARFKGIGVIVSHDREALDELTAATVFIEEGRVMKYASAYTVAREEHANYYAHLRGLKKHTMREAERIKKEYVRRREEAAGSDKRLSKKNIDPNDRSAKGKIDLARYTNKSADAGKRKRQIETRLLRAEAARDAIVLPAENELGIWFEMRRSHKRILLALSETTIPLGDARALVIPPMEIGSAQRIGVEGDNGSGKSSFMRHVVSRLTALNERILYIPQEITEAQTKAVLMRVQAYSNEEKGKLFTVVNRLNSDPKKIFDTALPSPGETRKLMLAEGILRNVPFMLFDEPTNHLDMPSVERLEEALKECPVALMLISHDRTFLDAIVYARLRCAAREDGVSVIEKTGI